MDGNRVAKKIDRLTDADYIVESIYYCATQRKKTMSSAGGLPVEDRWWDALHEAFKRGREYEKSLS